MIELENIVVKFGDFVALHNINVKVKEESFLPLRSIRLWQNHHFTYYYWFC